MSLIFMVPFAALITISLLCGNALGLTSRAIYFLLWIAGFVTVGVLEFAPTVFAAFQCLLGVLMLVQARFFRKSSESEKEPN